MKKMKWLALVAAVVMMMAMVLGGCANSNTDSPAAEGAKEITVIVVHGDSSTNTFTYHTDEEYLGPVLTENELAEGDVTDYGLFITTVDGETADSGNEEWWCITQSGEMLMTGADSTPIADGDQYELTFTVGYDSF